MSIFSREKSTHNHINPADIQYLTAICHEVASGNNPNSLQDFSGNPDLQELVAAISAIGQKNETSTAVNSDSSILLDVFDRLLKGDLEARITDHDSHSEIGKIAEELNNFLNVVQCFMSESGEVMRAVRDGEYYRRILPEGMGGEFLRHSKAINDVIAKIQDKDRIVKSMTEKFITNVKDMIVSSTDLAPKATAMSDTANHTKQFCDHAVKSANEIQ